MAKDDALFKLVDIIYAIAKEAGLAIIEHLKAHSDMDVRLKPDQSFITALDILASDIITQRIQAISLYPILCEETPINPYEERAQWPYYWLIDPLDGTRNLIEGTGEYTVNIALIKDHKPILGVVYVPEQQKGFFATYQNGAYQVENDHISRIHTRSFNPHQWTLALSRFYSDPQIEKALTLFSGMTLAILGSSLKVCEIACGKIDCYPRLGPTHEWDLAAAQIILEEAGGAIFDLGLNPLRYNTQASLIHPYFLAVGDKTRDFTWLLDHLKSLTSCG